MTFKNAELSYPPAPSSNQLASSFADFFIDKISSIQNGFQTDPYCVTKDKPMNVNTCLMSFAKMSPEALLKIITPIACKSCELDPVPAKVLKMAINFLLPVITKVVNLSLETGEFPATLKSSVIKPLLKKQSLPTDEFSSFRPISSSSARPLKKWLLCNWLSTLRIMIFINLCNLHTRNTTVSKQLSLKFIMIYCVLLMKTELSFLSYLTCQQPSIL